MKANIYDIRKKLEECIAELGGNWHGAGTNMLTGDVDFSFDLDNIDYSVHIDILPKKVIG